MESNYQYSNYITSCRFKAAIFLQMMRVHHKLISNHNSSEGIDKPMVKLKQGLKV